MYKAVQSSRLYEQIVKQIEESILKGELKPGDQLPSERELARRYGTAHMTARQALGLLKDEGLIATRQGRGSFVRPRPPLRIGSKRYSRQHRLEYRAGRGGAARARSRGRGRCRHDRDGAAGALRAAGLLAI